MHTVVKRLDSQVGAELILLEPLCGQALAIPGGSVLKMLAGSTPEWASKCTLAYVNHKAVSMDDGDLATHAKASKLFLDGWTGVNAIVMGGSGDAPAEASSYEEQLKAL
jgi:hypothetical protein